MLVRGVVVSDQMQIELARRLAVNLLEKAQPFDMGVARLGAGDQFAGQLDECGKQRDRAMPGIIVRHGAGALGRQRQAQLRAFERLALAFLVAAQHQRLCRRIEIEPDHIPKLLLELRIVGEFEGLQTMRLQVVLRPDALHRTGRDAGVPAHRSNAPTGLAVRRPCRLGDNPRQRRRRDRGLATPPRPLVEAGQTGTLKPPRPGRHALWRCLQLRGDGFDTNTLQPPQNDLGAFAITHPDRSGARPPAKFLHDIWLCPQSLDRPRNPRSSHSSTPPANLSRYLRSRTLEQLSLEYGAERRRLRVVKMRGMKYRGGYHDFTIQTGGLAIYPRLVAAEHHKAFLGELTSTDSPELDALLGGGIERGTSLLLIGGAGVGKSSIALTYAMAAAKRGERVGV